MLEVGKDGITNYERTKGKKAKVLGVEFGVTLLYKVPAGTKLEKIRPRGEDRFFVGVYRRSEELWVVNEGRVVAVRVVSRIPE